MSDEIRAESKQIQQDYLEILNDILEKVLEKGRFKGVDTSKDISIIVGKETKYKGNPKGEPSVNSVSSELLEKLNKAINDPQNLKGSVRILIGKDKVYHAKNGQVLNDELGLKNQIDIKPPPTIDIKPPQKQYLDPPPTIDIKPPQKQYLDPPPTIDIKPPQKQYSDPPPTIDIKPLQKQYSDPPPTIDIKSPRQQPSTLEDLQKQVTALQQKVQEQQKIIDTFTAQSQSNQPSVEEVQKLSSELVALKQDFEAQKQTIEQLQKGLEAINQKNNLAVKNTSLQDWINSVETKVKDTAKNLYEQVKTALTPKAEKIKTQLETQINSLKEQINQQVETLKGDVKTQLTAIKNEFESQVGIVNEGIDEVKQLIGDEIQHGLERHQAATGCIQGKISEEFNTINKQVIKAVGDIHSSTNHVVKENVEKVTRNLANIQAKALTKNVDNALRLFGTRNDDGSISYSTKKYNFHQKDGSITVTAKDGHPVVTDGQFSSQTTEKDIQALEQVGEIVSDYLKPKSQLQSRTTKLLR